MGTRNQRRLARKQILKEFSPKFWDDDDIADMPVVRKLRKRYKRLLEECEGEGSPSKESLCMKAVFFDCWLDSEVIGSITQEQKLDIGVIGQGINVLIGLLRSVHLNNKKQAHKGKHLPGRKKDVLTYIGRKSA